MCNLQEKAVVKPPAQLWKKKGLDESKFWFLLPGQLHFMFTQANLYLMSYKVYMFVWVTGFYMCIHLLQFACTELALLLSRKWRRKEKM